MIDLVDSLRIVYAKEGKERGEEITELMRDLRKCQSTLKKLYVWTRYAYIVHVCFLSL